MLLSYLKLYIRILLHSPFFTFINVLGLSAGFAVFVALWEYCTADLRSDQYHPDHGRITRVVVDFRWTDDGTNWGHLILGTVGPGTIHQITEDFPEVESSLRILAQQNFRDNLIHAEGGIVLSYEKPDGSKAIFKESAAIYADPNLFDFFAIPLLHGKKENILAGANSLVLSQTIAEKYFGRENPVGKLLVLNNKETLMVTGVYEDLPQNTHLDFDLVLSNTGKTSEWNSAAWSAVYGYLKLKEPADFKALEKKLATRKNDYWAEIFRSIPQAQADMVLQPLSEIVFSENYLTDHFKPKSKTMLITLSILSVVILVLAWVNYVNLTLCRMPRRMKEVGTRKMVGAKSLDLTKQFLIESILINILAIAIAFTVLQVVRVPAEQYLHIDVPSWKDMSFISGSWLLPVIACGIAITGLYPAVVSIRFNPRRLFQLRSQQSGSNTAAALLTTFQYVAAIVLIFSVIAVYSQLNYIFEKDRRGGTAPVAIVEGPIIRGIDYPEKIQYFIERLKTYSGIMDVTFSNSITGDSNVGNLEVKKTPEATFIGLDSNGGISENFLSFFGIKLLAGRDFQSDDKAGGVLLSKIAIQRLGHTSPEDAVGTKVLIRNPPSPTWSEQHVIGVFEDYRTKPYFSFSESSSEYSRGGRGLCLTYRNYIFPGFVPERIAVKCDPAQLEATLKAIQNLHQEIFPGNVPGIYFLDDHIRRHYANDQIVRNQLVFFALLTILIACLGLLGMVSNKAAQKTKELGIRKILGANIYQIARILVNTTVRQIILATAIGCPLAHYLVLKYLERFSDRIDVLWWHYFTPVALFVAIVFACVSYVLIRAATRNPADSLRYE